MKAFFKQNDNDTFTIQVFYHPRIVEFFKTFEDKSYNAEHHSFSFPNKHREEVVSHLVSLSVVVEEVNEIPPGKSYPKIVKWRCQNDLFEVYMAFNKLATTVLRANGCKFKRNSCRWHSEAKQKDNILLDLAAVGFICKEVEQFPEIAPRVIKVTTITILICKKRNDEFYNL
jgi:hypothetical protein